MLALPHRIEIIEIDTAGVLSHADQFSLGVLERRDPAGECRQLDEHHVTRADQHAGNQIDALLRSAGHDHIFQGGVDPARREDTERLLEQRLQPACGAVLKRVAVVAFEQCGGYVAQFVPGEHARIGISGRKRDEVSGSRDYRPHAPDRGFSELTSRLRQELLVVGHDRVLGLRGGLDSLRDRD